jgi:hypothetical protein
MISAEQMAAVLGNTIINTIPADGSITTPKYAPASITPAQLAPGLITYRDVQFTDAQLRALHGTPRIVIPAPGAGMMLQLMDRVFILADTSGGAYADASNDWSISIEYGGGVGALTFSLSNSGLTGVPGLGGMDEASIWTYTRTLTARPSGLVASYENQPIVLRKVTDSEFTGGASGNTQSWRFGYRVLPAVPFGA